MKLVASMLALLLAGVLFGTQMSSAGVTTQEKAAAKEVKWQGTVLQISKDKSTMSIRGGEKGTSTEQRKIAYDNNTEWTAQNKPGKQEDVKEGSFIIAVGTVDENSVLHAKRIDLRLPR